MIRQITQKEFLNELERQGAPDRAKLCFKCPMCGTIQCAADLIAAGAGKAFDDVVSSLGFSCIGRFTHHKPPPKKEDFGSQDGCNWTLGGLFQMHTLEVIMDSGEKMPVFEVATPDEAKAHLAKAGGNHAATH